MIKISIKKRGLRSEGHMMCHMGEREFAKYHNGGGGRGLKKHYYGM